MRVNEKMIGQLVWFVNENSLIVQKIRISQIETVVNYVVKIQKVSYENEHVYMNFFAIISKETKNINENLDYPFYETEKEAKNVLLTFLENKIKEVKGAKNECKKEK